MDKDCLVLKRALTTRPSGEWSGDDFDVLCDGVVVGRIMKAARRAGRLPDGRQPAGYLHQASQAPLTSSPRLVDRK
jgi:hypothetical protein